MARKIGEKMYSDGWKGLFGIDIIRDNELNKVFLIEINARQPASTTFESFLQEENRRSGAKGITTFEAHLRALTGQVLDQPLIPVNGGAQVIQRVTNNATKVAKNAISSLELAGYRVIPYSNTEYNSDLMRIQSTKGIMETHNELNARGKEILDMISN